MKYLNHVLVCILIGLFLPHQATGYKLKRTVMGSGGNISTESGAYELKATVSQAAIGKTTGTNHAGRVGFWHVFSVPITVSIPDTTSTYANQIKIPIRLENNVKDRGIVAAQVAITFDPNVINVDSISIDRTSTLTDSSAWHEAFHVVQNDTTSATLSIALITAQDTLSEPGDLVNIVIPTVNFSQTDSTALTLTTVLFNAGLPIAARYNGSLKLIGGTNATLSASYVLQALNGKGIVRDTLRIQVIDADKDLNTDAIDSVLARVTTQLTSDIETLQLFETGNSTGIFQHYLPTISTTSDSHDAQLSIAAWDTLSTSYTDNLTQQGDTTTTSVITRVVNLFGDQDGNGEVQAFDAAKILQLSVGLPTPTGQDSLVADVDGSGDILAADSAHLLQYVINAIDHLAIQTDTVFNPPDDPKNHPFLKPAIPEGFVTLTSLTPLPDGSFLMPLKLSERAHVHSGSLTLTHNNTVDILDVSTASDYDQFMITHNAEPDQVRIAFAGSHSNVKGVGDILHIKLKPKSDPPFLFTLDQLILNGDKLTPFLGPSALELQVGIELPLEFTLHQNQPNPFNPETLIRYDLPENTHVEIIIYNISGQQIRTLLSEPQQAGYHNIVWDGRNALGRRVGSGIYLVRLLANNFNDVRKMVLLK